MINICEKLYWVLSVKFPDFSSLPWHKFYSVTFPDFGQPWYLMDYWWLIIPQKYDIGCLIIKMVCRTVNTQFDSRASKLEWMLQESSLYKNKNEKRTRPSERLFNKYVLSGLKITVGYRIISDQFWKVSDPIWFPPDISSDPFFLRA